jgi:hypothetical protein
MKNKGFKIQFEERILEPCLSLAEEAGWVQKVANKKQQATSKGITATYRTKKESNAETGT